MSYNSGLNPLTGRPASVDQPADKLIALTDAMVGNVELPRYGTLRVVNTGSGVLEVDVVAARDLSDAPVAQTLVFPASVELLPLIVRRVTAVRANSAPVNLAAGIVRISILTV